MKPLNLQSHYQSSKWNSSRGLFSPQNQIHDEEDGEDNAGTKMSRQEHVQLPFLTAIHFVDAGRHVTLGMEMESDKPEILYQQGQNVHHVD